MLNIQTTATISSLLATCITLYYLTTKPTFLTTIDSIDSRMSASSNQQEREPSVEDLRIYLSHTWTPVPTVNVTIQNIHPTSHLSFLIWDTPIDRTALNSGILRLVDAVSGDFIQGPGLKITRLLPPPRDAMVELAPQDVVEVDIDLNAPWIPGDNKLVKVHAQGEWKAVWPTAKDDVTREELEAISGAGALSGPFRSARDVEMELAK